MLLISQLQRMKGLPGLQAGAPYLKGGHAPELHGQGVQHGRLQLHAPGEAAGLLQRAVDGIGPASHHKQAQQ